MGIEVTDARILLIVVLCLLCVSVISDTSIAANTSPQAIQEIQKLHYQQNEIVFSPLTQRDAAPGNVPIVNPTPPGTTPIITPINPLPPTTTGPPATITPPTPGPPATTTPTPPATTGSTTPGGSWCIANPGASPTALQVALDYACGYGGADCSPIQAGGPCYEPITVRDHASYAFNDYYQKNPSATSCVFGGAAQLTHTDPSHGNCRFAASSSNPIPPPMAPMTPTTPTVPMTPTTPTVPMTPPSTTTPINPYTPGGNGYGSEPTGPDYGSEPTSTPSSAGNVSVNRLLLVIMNSLILSVSIVNNI